MANEQTSVPLYAASEVLTAANMNISAGTGVPVFATTVTRDAAFGGANEKVLAEGQLCYLSASNIVQYYDGAAWATVGPATPAASGLTLVSTTTIGSAVSSVTVSNAFSATYDNYLVLIGGGVASVAGFVGLKLGAVAADYLGGQVQTNTGGTLTSAGDSFAVAFLKAFLFGTLGSSGTLTINSPFIAAQTFISTTSFGGSDAASSYIGKLAANTSVTAFTLTPASGTLTGGTIKVYGYANS